MSTAHWLSLLFMIGFIVVHFSSKFMNLPTSNPRSPILSIAGGMTVAYVFLYLLPELHKYLQPIKQAVSNTWLGFLEDYTYILALIGLLIYYGLDIVTRKGKGEESGQPSFGLFLLHISSFFLYNMIIGYLLIREEFSTHWAMALYFLALAAHFVATDHKLKELHKQSYDKYGRWFLVAAIFAGWLTGILISVHEVVVGIAVSVLAGGIIMNVFKDEIPESKSSNYNAFAIGALTVVILLLLVGK